MPLLEILFKYFLSHTKKAALTAALEEYIARHKQQQMLDLFNTIDYDKDYNYKKHREMR
jgi:hypothetical protein